MLHQKLSVCLELIQCLLQPAVEKEPHHPHKEIFSVG
uniref:Uncharacterized protein n=1 Tax=Arundo donax TaxID=35708 RepID=A0A0A8YE74_ARUDO